MSIVEKYLCVRALHVGLLALHGVRVNYRIADHVDLAKAEQIREWRQYSTLRELTDQAWLAWGMPLWLQALPLLDTPRILPICSSVCGPSSATSSAQLSSAGMSAASSKRCESASK